MKWSRLITPEHGHDYVPLCMTLILGAWLFYGIQWWCVPIVAFNLQLDFRALARLRAT